MTLVSRLADVTEGVWGQIRGVTAGLGAFTDDARDQAERFQDYGFAANPVDGEGLRIEVGGHTFILRMDRLADRPRLDAYEVSVWHKDGHHVTLKAGRLVAVECDQLSIKAAVGVIIETPTLALTGNQVVSGTTTAQMVVGITDVVANGTGLGEHDHGGVQRGSERSDGPG